MSRLWLLWSETTDIIQRKINTCHVKINCHKAFRLENKRDLLYDLTSITNYIKHIAFSLPPDVWKETPNTIVINLFQCIIAAWISEDPRFATQYKTQSFSQLKTDRSVEIVQCCYLRCPFPMRFKTIFRWIGFGFGRLLIVPSLLR